MKESRREAVVKRLDTSKPVKARRQLYSTIIEAADLFLGNLSYRYENGRILRDHQLLRIIHINH